MYGRGEGGVGVGRGGAVGWGTALHAEVDSASNKIEYDEYFLGEKGGRWVGLATVPLSRELKPGKPQPSALSFSLAAFAKLQKATISFVISVCPSVRMKELGSH